jgi:hypothetical protein
MDGDHVGGVEHFVERRRAADAQRRETVLRHVRIVADDVHGERARPRRDLASDAPDADDAERTVLQLAPEQPRAIPSPVPHR